MKLHKPLLLSLSVLALSLTGGVRAADTSAPELVKVPVPAVEKTIAPPSDDFMKEPSVNRSVDDLERAQNAASGPGVVIVPPPPPVAAPGLGLKIGQPVRSYQTLGDAAKAGVNPLAKKATSDIALGTPTVIAPPKGRNMQNYALIVGVIFVLLVIVFIINSRRKSAVPATE